MWRRKRYLMPKLKLYHMPMACSRVTMVALEETGLPFDHQPINILKGEQKTPEYLAINPDGKVPTLVVDDDRVITQNASILLYIHQIAPESPLFKASDDPVVQAQQRSDLIWCASTLHPTVRQVRMPKHFTVGNHEDVQAKGRASLADAFAQIDRRLSGQDWWYGDTWSIVDMYINWCIATAASTGFPLSDYSAIQRHFDAVNARPSVRAVMAKEAQIIQQMGLKPPQ